MKLNSPHPHAHLLKTSFNTIVDLKELTNLTQKGPLGLPLNFTLI